MPKSQPAVCTLVRRLWLLYISDCEASLVELLREQTSTSRALFDSPSRMRDSCFLHNPMLIASPADLYFIFRKRCPCTRRAAAKNVPRSPIRGPSVRHVFVAKNFEIPQPGYTCGKNIEQN